MAVAKSHQNQSVGSRYLLKHVFELAAQMHMTVGCSAVVVDSKPDAVGFYTKYGFLKAVVLGEEGSSSAEQTTMMYISIKPILGLIKP